MVSHLHIGLYVPGWPYGAAPNGIVTYVHWLRRALIEQGHRVTIFTHELAVPSAERADDEYISSGLDSSRL